MSGDMNLNAMKIPLKYKFNLVQGMKLRLHQKPATLSTVVEHKWRCKAVVEQDYMCSANWQVVDGTKRTAATHPPCFNDDAKFPAQVCMLAASFPIHIS